MKQLIIGDTHIEEKNIDEINSIFNEIYKYNADELIHLGDLVNKKVLSAKVLDFTCYWISKFKYKYGKVTILRGNHPAVEKDLTVIDFLNHFGISIYDDLEDNNNFYGHFMVNKSLRAIGGYKCDVEDLIRYNFVLLGHQHTFQEIVKDKMYHLGSCLYTSFNEDINVPKYIAFIENNKLEFKELKTPISMYDITDIKELENIPYLSKVRLTLNSFDELISYSTKIEEAKKAYYDFRIKINFENHIIESELNTDNSINDIAKEWLRNIKQNKEIHNILEKQFKDEGIL